jgi:uncharacterized protein (TIRG00374 family)
MRKFLSIMKLVMIPAIIGIVIWLSDVREVYAAMVRSGPGTVTVAFLLSIAAIALNAAKLQLVTPSIKLVELFTTAMIGQYYSFFFFGQASGEAAKIYLISRTSGNVSGAAVSVFTDRLSSFIGLLTVSVIGFAMSSSSYPAKLQQTAVIGLVLLVVGLLALRHDAFFLWAERIACWIESRSPKYSVAIARELRRAIEQWHMAVGKPWSVMAGISMGALVHLANILTLISLAFGIGIAVDLFDWCWIAGLMSIAGLVPLTIGQMTAGGALVALLRLQDVSMVDALALSVLVLLVSGMLAIIGGVMEWRRLRRPRAASASSAADGTFKP